MAKRRAWVLDTGTKGTGAEMVPLDKLERKPEPEARELAVRRLGKPPQPKETDLRRARTFKVVDALSRQVLGEGVDARATVELLAGMRSITDVSVYVRDESPPRWRSLTLDERRALWERRGSSPRPERERG